MEGTSNCGQRKDTYQAIGFKTDNPDNTKETSEQQEKVANWTGPNNKKTQKAPKPKPPIKIPQNKRDDSITREDNKNEDLDITIDAMKKGQKRVKDLIKIITDTDQNRNNKINSPIEIICAAELNAAINIMENA